MYRDPNRIRRRVVKIRYSVEEDRLIEALADYTGDEKAALVRELSLERARAILDVDQFDSSPLAAEGATRGRGRA